MSFEEQLKESFTEKIHQKSIMLGDLFYQNDHEYHRWNKSGISELPELNKKYNERWIRVDDVKKLLGVRVGRIQKIFGIEIEHAKYTANIGGLNVLHKTKKEVLAELTE